ncbi:penicillin-binding protein [Gordonibacter sp. An230]|uniref:PASTA domain-containing protein n=1 Tax=Gordonibacter sp. An230 TaxID=1965592 RepID=UPI000B39DD3C|nr:PASTA domain-containing protein [Gordonibacter sp. An230]OUO91505.1 penicillin-binding protein [Gordonibacter sp. An230]
MICPHCHSENRDGARFCNDCGLPLSGKIAELAAAVDKAESDSAADAGASKAVPGGGDKDDSSVSSDPAPSPSKARAGASGPLDPSALPSIDVAGVNVDENGDAYDFGPLPGASEEGSSEEGADVARAADDLAPFVPKRPAAEEVVHGADLTGIDECLVDASYVPPAASWRSGDTMEMPRVEGDSAPKQKEFRAPDANAKRGGKAKVVAIVLACLAALGLAAAGATYCLELWGGKMLPDVVGMTQTDAVYALEGKGFSVRVLEVKSDETEGVVLLMDPGAGTRMEEGTEVTIHVAASRSIPEGTVGVPRDEAANLLSAEGFENVTYATEESGEHEGLVLSIDPAPGTKATASTPITVTVAVPYTIPDVTGMTWDEAKAALEEKGFSAAVSYVYDESVEAGTAIGTDPAAGSNAAPGASVVVNVALSRAAELESATWGLFSEGASINIGGVDYLVSSCDAVAYEGSETTSFTITAKPYTTLLGVTLPLEARSVSGTIVWNADNTVASITGS